MKNTTTILQMLVPVLLSAQAYTVSTAIGNGFVGNVNGNAASCELDRPYGVKYVNDSLLFFCDDLNHSIKKLNVNTNIVSTIAGTGAPGYTDGIGTVAKFNAPGGLFYLNNFIYVADCGNHVIRKIDLNNNNTVSTIAGTGAAGFANGSVTSAKFNNPFGLHVESNGDIYVADYANHCVRLISNGQVTTFAGVPTSAGNVLGAIGIAKFNDVRDIIRDVTGDFYIADQNNNQIKKISGGNVSVFAGTSTAGSADGSANAATFYHPVGICRTNIGKFYIVDSGNNKIRKADSTGTITTVAGTGTASFQDGAGSSAMFNAPGGITFDPHGNIFVGDNLNNRVRKISIPEFVGVKQFHAPFTSIEISPNPTSDILSLRSDQEIGEIRIFNEIGGLVYTDNVHNTRYELNVKSLNSGIYFIKSGIATFKFVKQ